MDLNYLGTVHAVKAVLPDMVAAGAGHLVLVASAAAVCGALTEPACKLASLFASSVMQGCAWRCPLFISLIPCTSLGVCGSTGELKPLARCLLRSRETNKKCMGRHCWADQLLPYKVRCEGAGRQPAQRGRRHAVWNGVIAWSQLTTCSTRSDGRGLGSPAVDMQMLQLHACSV